MNRWSTALLGELAAELPYACIGGPFGSELTTKDYVASPGVPVIRGSNLSENGFVDDGFVYVSERKAQALRANQAYRGDILFTQRGTIGQLAIIPWEARHERYVLSQSQMKLTPNVSRIDPRFLFHYFRSPAALSFLTRNTLATGVPHINLSILRRAPVPVPPLHEQHRIAEVLDKADALRAKRRAALAQLDMLAKSIFLDMFGDPATNPKGWPQGRLDSACELVNGRAFKPEEWEESGSPIIRIQNLNDGAKPFNYTTQSIPERFRVRTGDILFSWSGTPGTSFGCFRWNGSSGWLNQHIFNVHLNAILDGEYFIAHVNLKLGELVAKAHGGVGLQHVTRGMVEETMLMIPPLTLQREFTRRASAIGTSKRLHRIAQAELDSLFASIQHRAFRGEL